MRIYEEQEMIHGSELTHHGILGQKWGVRRFQNPDGTLTEAGKKRYYNTLGKVDKYAKRFDKNDKDVRKNATKYYSYGNPFASKSLLNSEKRTIQSRKKLEKEINKVKEFDMTKYESLMKKHKSALETKYSSELSYKQLKNGKEFLDKNVYNEKVLNNLSADRSVRNVEKGYNYISVAASVGILAYPVIANAAKGDGTIKAKGYTINGEGLPYKK